MAGVPLAVDMDGTLIRTDTLHESLLVLARTKPLLLPRLPIWLARGGRAGFKRKVAESVTPNVDSLPVNQGFVDWLGGQRLGGRRLVLVTAADSSLATRIADRVGVFDDVLASDGVLNLSGSRKAGILVERFGEGGYDYAGNSRADVEVWRHARRAIIVNPNRDVATRAAAVAEVETEFPSTPVGARTWLWMLRAHQWLKNVLVALPLIAAHERPTPDVILGVLLAFAAMSMCASAVYVVNDLVDLEHDRLHVRKRTRPFASGRMPLWVGIVAAPTLFGTSVWLATIVNMRFLAWLLVYVAVTTAYSFALKRLAILDCLVLALLYTLRVVAGAAATQITLSFWLLALCVFVFLSLAFLKRYAELLVHTRNSHGAPEGGALSGRGYSAVDSQLVQMLGVASGFAAVLVFAMYLDSPSVRVQYLTPEILWAGVLVLLYWLSWLWLKANRGEMHDDPVIFAAKDRTSLASGAVLAIVFTLASFVRL